MNLDHELNKIKGRFVECEREPRIHQRGADNFVRTPLFVPARGGWRGMPGIPMPLRSPSGRRGTGGGDEKSARPLPRPKDSQKADGRERDAPAPSW